MVAALFEASVTDNIRPVIKNRRKSKCFSDALDFRSAESDDNDRVSK